VITIGLDIGTTTISVVAYDSVDGCLAAETVPNSSFLEGKHAWERIQDPDRIWEKALKSVRKMKEKYPSAFGIGVTGQMHGIVYLDRSGKPCSPLYTWQDARGNEKTPEGKTYAEELSELTGYSMSAGVGLTTHYYNIRNGLDSPQAVVFCTIQDYAAMKLAGRTTPVTDASDAASMGLFSLEDHQFDRKAVIKAGMDPEMLPVLSREPCLGAGEENLPVMVAIGDNQASFLGATGGNRDSILINLGTGGQFSAYSADLTYLPSLETRPCPGGGYLLVGSSLCGGRAYALWEEFVRKCAELVTGQTQQPCYDALSRMLTESVRPENCPEVRTTFNGTRQNPELRGAFTELGTDNLTPLHLTYGLLSGMIKELYQMYLAYCAACPAPKNMIGSGNGLRKNPVLQKMAEEIFGLPLIMSEWEEEAACGAAVYAQNAGIAGKGNVDDTD